MKNLVKTLETWKLDKSKYTDEQNQILEKVNFPNGIGRGHVLQKRIARRPTGEGFIDREVVTLEHIKYTTCARAAAMIDQGLKQLVTKDKDGRELDPQLKKMNEQHHVRLMKSKAKKYEYFNISEVDQEINDLFAQYGTPAITKNMVVEDEEIYESKTEVVEKKQKRLSNKVKGQIKLLYSEESKNADEISKELNEPLDLVIDYIKNKIDGQAK